MAPHLTFLDLRAGTRPMSAPPARAVMCLGNFDGVHRAHAALLQEGVYLAARLSSTTADHAIRDPRRADVLGGVFCFYKPSSDFTGLKAGMPAFHLTTLRDKLTLFAEVGIAFVCLCDFREIRDMDPGDFLHFLENACGCEGVVCGFNFRFGHAAAGNVSMLKDHFGADRTVVLPEMTLEGETVSSSRIREMLIMGDAESATRLLGRPYSLNATVTHGKRLGRTIGFPTANQYFPTEALVPAHGVYVALCHTPNGVFPAVSNVGTHPTVDARARVNCESYLLGYCGDLYGIRVKTELLCRLRPERKFPGLPELTEAIRRDIASAEAYLRSHGLWPHSPEN